MTRVHKAATVAVLTPLAAATIAVAGSAPADAASGCLVGTASINAPSGALTAGSSVHVSAQISGILLQAHLQISGPGLNQQVGPSGSDGTIGGDVTIRQPGYFSLAVIGNGTGCTYDTRGFSVKDRPSSAKPSQPATPPSHSQVTGGGSGGGQAAPGGLPGGFSGGNPGNPGIPGKGGSGAGFKPSGVNAPFSLPSVMPDGSAPAFQNPTPDPEVASPPAKPLAHDVASTTPITWGRSIAVALILLLLAAHLGMWSRRQRLAAEGARAGRRGKGAAGSTKRRPGVPATDVSTSAADDAGRDPQHAVPPRRTYIGRRRRRG